MSRSHIRGVDDGHLWRNLGSEQVGAATPWMKATYYKCKRCHTKFVHRYDLVPDIVQAMRMERVPERCPMAGD